MTRTMWAVLAALVVALAASTAPSRAAPLLPPGAVRGGAVALPRDEITPTERARIETMIATNLQILRDAGRLPPIAPKAGTPTPLQWPLQLVPGHPEQVARTVNNYVDHDPEYPDQLQDYNCGTRTYDTADGYNHQGTDITAFPFAWRKMDNDEAIVVAAAPGVIIAKEDGQFDRSCTLNDNPWNAVYLRHLDGSIAWYGHLKNGSLTAKKFGEWVLAGEFIGVMGSSGDSTGPHVHLEVYDNAGNLVDPFAGACNNFNSQSWWADQRPYNEPAIDLVMTGDAPVDFSPCPTPEVEHRAATSTRAKQVILTAFLPTSCAPMRRYTTYTRPMARCSRRRRFKVTPTTTPHRSGNTSWCSRQTLRLERGASRWCSRSDAERQFEVGAPEPPRIDIVEYYAASLDHYFMTGFPTEEAALDARRRSPDGRAPACRFPRTRRAIPRCPPFAASSAHPAWASTRTSTPPSTSMCRTVKQEPDWTFEADAFYIAANVALCPASTRPVFRLYNNGMGGDPNHRYTTSWPVINAMQFAGWVLEGVAFCAPL